MSKIYFNGGLIYDKDHLPSEEKAMSLLRTYLSPDLDIVPEAAEALSCGIDVWIGGGKFTVELANDKERFEMMKGRKL